MTIYLVRAWANGAYGIKNPDGSMEWHSDTLPRLNIDVPDPLLPARNMQRCVVLPLDAQQGGAVESPALPCSTGPVSKANADAFAALLDPIGGDPPALPDRDDEAFFTSFDGTPPDDFDDEFDWGDADE